MSGDSFADSRAVAFSGGVGGAKLVLGLSRVLSSENLLVVANTGDDFEHVGLHICPDIDTLIYALSGLANPETGWGRGDETWGFMDTLRRLGGEDWFLLGDRDVALHARRTELLKAGWGLDEVTREIARRLDVPVRIVPMSDDPVRTQVRTDAGELEFQRYFVREKAGPRVLGVRFVGAESARPNGDALAWLADPRLSAVVICPSNPYLSIDPILSVAGFREAVGEARAPVIAVSPIVGGAAVKGPTAKIMRELGLEPSALTVARHYGGLIDGFVLDERDSALAQAVRELGRAVRICNTVMRGVDDKVGLARQVMAFAHEIRGLLDARRERTRRGVG